jgi:hypothetical protein
MQLIHTKEFLNIVKNEFRLQKYNPYCKQDYYLFRTLLLQNMQYSALQYMIPNMTKEVDVCDLQALQKYFNNPIKENYCLQAYQYITRNNLATNIGYYKILNKQNIFIGNAGWIIHKVENQKASEVERGIHLNIINRSSDIADKKQYGNGAKVMKLILANIEEHQESVDMEGKIISTILKTNTRSQRFTTKHKLNIGEPVLTQNNTYKWERKTKDFIAAIPEMQNELNKTIEKAKSALRN